MENIKRVQPDKELANSLIKTALLREKSITFLNPTEFTTIVIEANYEVIKELRMALLSLDGYRASTHEAMINYLKLKYDRFSTEEILFLDNLRKIRNNINYKGYQVTIDYYERNKKTINTIISKLKKILTYKIGKIVF
jgi:hypothetical protein